jgi:hypothetical protein
VRLVHDVNASHACLRAVCTPEVKGWLASLPAIPSGYVVYKLQRGLVVYIGTTKHLRRRMIEHTRKGPLSKQPCFPQGFSVEILHGHSAALSLQAAHRFEYQATSAARATRPPVVLLNSPNIDGQPTRNIMHHIIRSARQRQQRNTSTARIKK